MGQATISVFRRLRRAAARLWRDRDGGLLTAYALFLPLLLGVTGLGLETGLWYTSKRNLQTQTDAASLSGAFERAQGHPDYASVSAAALKEAERNGFVNAAPNTIAINNPPASGPNEGSQAAVEVIVTTPQSLLFSSFFLDGLTVRARSVAAVETTGTACVLALDPSTGSAIQGSGNPTIEMDGCVLGANSTSSSAIDISGSAVLDADSLWTAGDVSISSSAHVTLDRPPNVNAWPLDDPYSAVEIPPLGTCDHSSVNYDNVTTTIDPGVYCGNMTFGPDAIITLNPGTYYVNKGNIDIAATAVLRCSCPDPEDGVTFVLTSDGGGGSIGTMTINGGADVVLNAPTAESDPYKGLLIYQDRRAPPGPTVKFNGGATMQLTGGIYIPKQKIEWAGGNASSGSTCTQIIGRTVAFVGNSKIVNTGCEAAGVEPIEIVGVRLVE